MQKHFAIRITDDEHKLLRLVAQDAQQTMTAVIIEAIERKARERGLSLVENQKEEQLQAA